MSNASDFIIENGVLTKYVGPGGNVVVPENVKKIGIFAMQNCATVTSVSLPESLEKIESFAFRDCTGLISVSIPSSVKLIGSYAFDNCSALVSISLGNGISEIAVGMFNKCVSLQSISIPDSVLRIGEGAFCLCIKLTHVEFPKYLRRVEAYAFQKCDSLTCVTLPEQLQIIGAEALDVPIVAPYEAVPSALRVKAAIGFAQAYFSGEKVYDTEKYLKYMKTQRKRLLEVVQQYPVVLQVMLREKLIPVGELEPLEQLLWGNCPPEITAELLEYKNSLQSRPKKKTAAKGELVSDILLDNVVPTLGELKKTWSYQVLEDGSISLTSYKGYESTVFIPQQAGKKKITRIGRGAFAPQWATTPGIKKTREEIVEIIVPAGIVEIEDGAFHGCAGLKRIVLPEGLQKIGANAFRGCTSLENITIPEGVRHIGSICFGDCEKLAKVILTDTLEELGTSVFSGCSSLEVITIPANIREIKDSTFNYCKSLKTIKFLNGVQRICEEAVKSCDNLTEVHIPASVLVIEREAFVAGFMSQGLHFTIHAPAGSYAETYAKENNIPFVAE